MQKSSPKVSALKSWVSFPSRSPLDDCLCASGRWFSLEVGLGVGLVPHRGHLLATSVAGLLGVAFQKVALEVAIYPAATAAPRANPRHLWLEFEVKNNLAWKHFKKLMEKWNQKISLLWCKIFENTFITHTPHEHSEDLARAWILIVFARK